MSATRLAHWQQRQVNAMGSPAHVVAGDADDTIVDWAIAELERLEQCWSRFRSDSELCRLHATAGGWADISPTMLAAITRARDIWALTDGAFDPTVLAALEAAGYDRSFADVVHDDPRPSMAAVPVPGFGLVRVEPGAHRVFVPAGTRIDLGGIGKGLAADLVAQGMVERGARTALVALGGDLRACGEPPTPEGWPVPVEHPCHPGRVAFVHPLVTGGLVTSTTRVRTWTRAGKRMHHIIDPLTGTPSATDVVAVVAAAPSTAVAEGVAKAMVVAGDGRAHDIAERTGVQAWCYLTDGTVRRHCRDRGR